MRRHKEHITLTKSEMEIMSILWSMDEGMGSVRDILEHYGNPKPAYTTVSTFLRILTQKGFVESVKREGEGKTFNYRPLISQDDYRRRAFDEMKNSMFNGSAKSLVSFFMQQEGISPAEVEELLQMIKQQPQL
jgi:predicted transcriptional regulator